VWQNFLARTLFTLSPQTERVLNWFAIKICQTESRSKRKKLFFFPSTNNTATMIDHEPSLIPRNDASEITARSRPLRKRIIHTIRRGHLYLGLFLLPWAALYGVTAFLFNHPTAFSEQSTTTFERSAILGTPMESPPSAEDWAAQVMAKLNEIQKPATAYTLLPGAKFGGRDFAFATVKAEGQNINVLIDVKTSTGTVRSTPMPEPKPLVKAPFAIGNASEGRRPGPGGSSLSETGIQLENPLTAMVRETVPVILERTGFPGGDVTVTSVPDLQFSMEVAGKTWNASYNFTNGSVSGVEPESAPKPELGWRRFLTRLHTTHGYPGEANGRWFWAVIVDAMAFTMCFWSLSGLIMWWQIKATRKIGAVVLMLSTACAVALGFAMHAALTT